MCENKLITSAYNVATTMVGNVNELQFKVKEKYTSAVIIHCCTCVLNLEVCVTIIDVFEHIIDNPEIGVR